MSASQRDRSFLERIGQLKARSHAASSAKHLDLPLADRLMRSWALFQTFRKTNVQAPRRAEEPAFFARAKALGLYQRQG